MENRRRELERKREALEARINALRTEFEEEEGMLRQLIEQETSVEEIIEQERAQMAVSRRADAGASAENAPARTRKKQGRRA